MAKRTRKSSLKVNPYKAHAQDETEYGTEFVDLPGGISGGVARLTEAKVGIYVKGKNVGEKFVYLAGTVIEPKFAVNTLQIWKDGKIQVVSTKEVEVKGQFTGMTLPLCNTSKADGEVVTADENIAKMMNELRKLGGEECTLEVESEETLAQVLGLLKEEGPFFKFSTSSSKPNEQYPEQRVWENWFGAKGLEDYEPEEEDDVEEDVDSDDSEEPKEEDANDSGEDSTPDLAALVETANEVDENEDATESAEEAQHALSELASSVGISKKDADAMDTWDELAAEIAGAPGLDTGEPGGGGASVDGDEDSNWVPKKEEVYRFKPPRARKAVDVIITTVNEKAQTVTAKALENDKTYKAVLWSKLEDV